MKMFVSWCGFLVGMVGVVVLLGLFVFVQEFLVKVFIYIVFYIFGGMSDNILWLIGQKLMEKIGQQVVNDYKFGVGGVIGVNFYIKILDDGYMLLQVINSFFGVIFFVIKVEYDLLIDLILLVLVGDVLMVMVVYFLVQVNMLEEFIVYVKVNFGVLVYVIVGKGMVGYLCGEWL